MKTHHSLLALWLLQLSAAQAVVYVDGSSNDWTPMAGVFDFLVDQQTGQPESDLVGDAQFNPGFLVVFNDNGDVSSIDGEIGFRVRLDQAGGSNNNPEFTRVVWVGIDANFDGALDAFLGANLQGNSSSDAIEIRAPGSGANISPNTTSIANNAYWSQSLTSLNYNYRQVVPQAPKFDGGTTNDMTANTSGDPDYYLSFMVPFGQLVNFFQTRPTPISITDTSPLRFVLATSTQVNSLNQDLGGINGGVNSTETWENLGGFTQSFSPVPEPSASFLLLGSLVAGCFRRRR